MGYSGYQTATHPASIKRMELLFTIDDYGNAFIETQIRKSISYFSRLPFIALFLLILFAWVKVNPMTWGAVIFGAGLYAILNLFHYKAFKRTINVHQHLIKQVEVKDNKVELTGFRTCNRQEITYRLNLPNLY
jgi:hypothetical protein